VNWTCTITSSFPVQAKCACFVGITFKVPASTISFWERLIVNVGIVLVFAAFYLRFLKRPCVVAPERPDTVRVFRELR